MATKPFVPPKRCVAYSEVSMPPARPWLGNRPGEVADDPHASSFGSVGPDTGYVGHLALLFRDRLVTGRLHGEDAIAAGTALAARRAALYGRGPIIEDLETAFLLLGVLEGVPGDWSRVGDQIVSLVRGMRHETSRANAVAAEIPGDWLMSKPRDVRERLGREGPERVWAGIRAPRH